MTFHLKPISREAIPAALQKAERYRVIGDPSSAESICLDVLTLEPANQTALTTLILAITDQFRSAPMEGLHRALELLPRLRDEYRREYYAGIVCERCAKAQMHLGSRGSGAMAHHWLSRAMAHYEMAESLRPAGNDEAILRWNACARLLARNPELQPRIDEPAAPGLE